MLRRHGWSHQVPARRAVERDEQKVTGWVKDVWPHVEPPRRCSKPGSSSMTKPDSRSRRRPPAPGADAETTPVIRVRGRSQRRFSIAALCCYKPGERSRLVYRPKRHTDHKSGGHKSFAWTEYRDLLIAAHQQLGGPVVLSWDNLNFHEDRRMRAFIDAHDWLTVDHLPAYAPGLNPGGRHMVAPPPHQPGQHRLHRPRPPHPPATAQPPPDPIPQRHHRRMPHRNRTHTDDTTPTTSVTTALLLVPREPAGADTALVAGGPCFTCWPEPNRWCSAGRGRDGSACEGQLSARG